MAGRENTGDLQKSNSHSEWLDDRHPDCITDRFDWQIQFKGLFLRQIGQSATIDLTIPVIPTHTADDFKL